MFDRLRRGGEPAHGATTDERTAVADAPAERRFHRDDTSADPGPGAVSGAGLTQTHEPVRERRPLGEERDGEQTAAGGTHEPVRERRPFVDAGRDERRPEDAATAPLVAPRTMAAVRERQREHFGGVKWGSAFFGFLSAVGLASILAAILAAAGIALGLADRATGSDASASDAQTIGLGGGIALLVALAFAWYCGGYVAGRMARFDGARQGLGVWAWTMVTTILVAAAAGVGGSRYDIFQSLNLPSLPVNGSTLTSAGAIAGAAAILVTLLFAVLGGKAGERYHRRVDRVAHDEAVA
jgi:hypothetical protein